jgi:hypothetical protein
MTYVGGDRSRAIHTSTSDMPKSTGVINHKKKLAPATPIATRTAIGRLIQIAQASATKAVIANISLKLN